jgi:hypothetical protein
MTMVGEGGWLAASSSSSRHLGAAATRARRRRRLLFLCLVLRRRSLSLCARARAFGGCGASRATSGSTAGDKRRGVQRVASRVDDARVRHARHHHRGCLCWLGALLAQKRGLGSAVVDARCGRVLMWQLLGGGAGCVAFLRETGKRLLPQELCRDDRHQDVMPHALLQLTNTTHSFIAATTPWSFLLHTLDALPAARARTPPSERPPFRTPGTHQSTRPPPAALSQRSALQTAPQATHMR